MSLKQYKNTYILILLCNNICYIHQYVSKHIARTTTAVLNKYNRLMKYCCKIWPYCIQCLRVILPWMCVFSKGSLLMIRGVALKIMKYVPFHLYYFIYGVSKIFLTYIIAYHMCICACTHQHVYECLLVCYCLRWVLNFSVSIFYFQRKQKGRVMEPAGLHIKFLPKKVKVYFLCM